MNINKAVITCSDTLKQRGWDDFTIPRMLVEKGLRYKDGPIAPRLLGTITMYQDMCDDSYHYKQITV